MHVGIWSRDIHISRGPSSGRVLPYSPRGIRWNVPNILAAKKCKSSVRSSAAGRAFVFKPTLCMEFVMCTLVLIC